MHFSRQFYRGAALCSFLSVLTTLLLIFLPRLYQPVADFDARMALGANPIYVARSWIYLFHPFLVFAAALAVAVRCRTVAGGAASLGIAGFTLWAMFEIAQQALTKVALDHTWRAAWPAADSLAREAIRQQVALFDVFWGAMYFTLLLGFLAGNVFLALASSRASAVTTGGSLLARWVSRTFWAVAALTLLNLLPEFGAEPITIGGWLYPIVQPATRLLIGVWLWYEADREPAA